MAMASVTPLEASVEATLSTLRAQLPQWRDQPFTIFRVPAYVRESNPTAYEPRMVSIGPYYHGDVALRAMEDHKWRYLHDLLSRSPAVSSSLLIQEMRSMESRARACYSERPALESDEFVRMLLLDASFILEFFFKWHTNLFLEYMINPKDLITLPSVTSDVHHLLHLHYESAVPKRPPEPSKVRVIPRATEMSAAGVTFIRRPRSKARDMYDVAFDGGRGVMEIPAMVIDDMKRPLLINLIAFEQSQGREEAGVVTSYVSLMGMLVRTSQDVELLRRCGILENLLADDDEAARFFSHLGDGGVMNYERQVFSGLYQDVQRYCGSWWHRNRASLRRDYFGSPWSVISFVVAGLLVALTTTQTYFTVFPSK